MNKKQFFALFLSTSLLTISCSKDETPAPAAPVATTPAPVSPDYPTNQGLLQLINSVNIMNVPILGEQAVDVYTAVAVISDLDGKYLNVGAVSVEDKALAIQSNNSYIFSDFANPIAPSGNTDWKIAGSAFFAGANLSSSTVVPKLVDVKKPTEVNLQGGTINIDSKSESKILVVLVGDNGKSVKKEFNGGATSASFTKEELAELKATTNGFVQITPYNYVVRNVNGKDIVVGNQSTYSYQGVTFK